MIFFIKNEKISENSEKSPITLMDHYNCSFLSNQIIKYIIIKIIIPALFAAIAASSFIVWERGGHSGC